MSSPIRAIEEKLRKYPALRLERGANFICVLPEAADGFEVELREHGRTTTVFMEGWHEEFEEPDEALDTFAVGLSDHARLQVVSRGSVDCSWTLEIWEAPVWVRGSTTALIFVPFWRRSSKRYLQNRHIELTPP